MWTQRSWLLLCVLCLGGLACEPSTSLGPCKKDGDCPADRYCKGSECVPRARCSKFNAREICTRNEACVEGVCMPKSSGDCAKDGCPGGMQCDAASGSCVECLDRSDCPGGVSCVNNRCLKDAGDSGPQEGGPSEGGPSEGGPAEGTGCKDDGDCQESERCDLQAGICRKKTGSACEGDKDCPGDEHCLRKSCVEGRRGCDAASKECQVGFQCREGSCYRSQCQNEKDCLSGESCDPLTRRCKASDCTASGCPSGQVCNPATKRCEASSQDCTTTGCPSGQRCNGSTRRCEPVQDCTSTGCSAGEVCNPTTKRCEPQNPNDCTRTGCPSGQVCNRSTGRCEGSSQDCRRTGCPSGQRCNTVTLRCEATNDCTVTGCPAGQVCNRSTRRCEASSQDCTTTGCPAGQRCNLSTRRCERAPGVCRTNADCAAPTGTCRAGTCVSCSSVGCSSGRVCDAATGLCKLPPPCSSNADCKAPKGTCRSGTCASCAGDFNCASGQNCDSATGLCQVPAAQCTTNSSCSGGKFCKDGVCLRRGCDIFTPCSDGKVCKNGECVALWGRCLSSKCASTERCLLDPDGNVRCHAPCTGSCASGDCLKLALNDGTTASFCFASPTVAAGRSCKPYDQSARCIQGHCIKSSSTSSSGTCYSSCVPGSTSCGSRRLCVELRPGVGACLGSSSSPYEGSYCSMLTSRCSSKYACVTSYFDSTTGRCRDRCAAPGSASTCTGGRECVALPNTDGHGACITSSGRSSEGRSCNLTAGSRCAAGLGCDKGPESSSGICRTICKADADCSSRYPLCVEGFCRPKGSSREGSSCRISSTSASYHCLTTLRCVYDPAGTSTYGRCLRPCASDSNCSSSTYSSCERGFCLRKGTRKESQSCSAGATSSTRCASGLNCLKTSSFSYYCHKPCASDSDCSSQYPECYSGFCLSKSTRTEGNLCGSSLSSRCVKPLLCLRGTQFGSNLCLKPCTANSDCTGTYTRCIASPDGPKVCYR